MAVLTAPAPCTAAEVPAARRLAPTPWKAIAAVVAGKSALQASVLGRYGWHFDELYYAATARRPALGYVDFPPVTPMIGWVVRHVAGDSLVALRSAAVLAGAGVIVLAALIARELGGGRRAQTFAALAIAASPVLLGANSMFQTVSFDGLCWAIVLYVFVRLLRRPSPATWLALGAAAGLGLETKYTIAMLLAAVAIAVMLSSGTRRWLGTPWPWLAVVVAGAMAAPNLWWQARHGWPSVDFFTGRGHEVRAENPPLVYLRDQFFMAGPATTWVAVVGVVAAVRRRAWRPLVVVAAVVVGGFLATGGKGYYGMPVYVLLFAAGAVVLEPAFDRRPRLHTGVAAAVVAGTLAFSPLMLPTAPAKQMLRWKLWDMRQDYADEIGWPALVDTVARAYDALPAVDRAAAVIYASDYAEAGALERWGPARGLPPVASRHLTYAYWGPQRPGATVVLGVGWAERLVRPACRDLTRVATIDNGVGVDNEEQGAPVWVCHLRGTFGGWWRGVWYG